MASEQTVGLKWLILNKPIKRKSVGPGNMSRCGTSSFYDHLDHCFVVLKYRQQSCLMRRLDVWGKKINIIQIIDHSIRLLSSLKFCEVLNELHVCSTTGLPVLSWFWVASPRTETITFYKSRAGTPSNLNPASKEMISDSVELFETEVCFLHIQLIGTNVWLSKTYSVPPEVDFESSRSPAKSESWNSPNLHCCAVFPTWQYCLKIERDNRLVHALVHFVMDRASLFTDHKISGRPIRAENNNISLQFESILVTILQKISFLLLWSDGHQCKGLIFCRVVSSSCWLTHNIAPHISLDDPLYLKAMKKYEYLPSMVVFSVPSRGNSRFKHGSVFVHNIFAYLALSLSAAQVYMI